MAEQYPPTQQYSHPRRGNPHRGQSYRGNRGRSNNAYYMNVDEQRPNVGKAMHNFGVRDMRDWLNKKHDHENTKPGPPPDPPNNFLKDPSRDLESGSHSRDQPPIERHKEHNHEKKVQFEEPIPQSPKNSHFTRARGGRNSGRGRGRGYHHNHNEQQQSEAIKDPVNIRVELSISTGKKNYIVEEDKKIADIKHVPDHVDTERKSFRGRGRGKRRGFGHRPDRNKSSPEGDQATKSENQNEENTNNTETVDKLDNNVNDVENPDVEEQESFNEDEDNVNVEYSQNSDRKVEINDSDVIKVNINNPKPEEVTREEIKPKDEIPKEVTSKEDISKETIPNEKTPNEPEKSKENDE